MTSVLFILSVNFLETANIVLAPHNTFSQVSGVASIGFTIFFVRGGRKFFFFLFFSQDGIKTVLFSLRKCYACTVRFFKKIPRCYRSCLFLTMLGRLNARARFRAMAEASMPLNTLSFAETSSSQLVDRESQPVKI